MESDNTEVNVLAQPGERYARQAVLPVIGVEGQRQLAASTVLIIGCGALGSAQAELAARAGVGKLVIVDRDILELHNLQRQLLFAEEDVHKRLPKAVAAARRLRAINSEILIEPVVADVTAANIMEFVQSADLILDGTDNFETRYLINDAAVSVGKPWIYGGVLGTAGTVMAVRPGSGPCLRCLFPEPPDASAIPTCETMGVLGSAVAWVAALQVTEMLKLLIKDPDCEYHLYSLDVWQGHAAAVSPAQRAECVCCGARRFEFLGAQRGSSATAFCGRHAVQITPARPMSPNFAQLATQLMPLGKVSTNGLVLEFTLAGHRLVVFPDGRVLVMGTTDVAEARGLVAKYIGS